MPVGLREVDVVVLRGLLDVRERQRALVVGDVDHLIEARDRVAHVRGVGQRLLALLGKTKTVSGRSLCVVSVPCFSCGIQVAACGLM